MPSAIEGIVNQESAEQSANPPTTSTAARSGPVAADAGNNQDNVHKSAGPPTKMPTVAAAVAALPSSDGVASTGTGEEAKANNKRKQSSNNEGGTTPKKKKRTFKRMFVKCRECETCRLKDCGKCVNCLDKPIFGGEGKRRVSCVLRKCRSMISTDGLLQQIVVSCPPGLMGLTLEKQEDDLIIVKIHPQCTFSNQVKLGDQLLSIDRSSITKSDFNIWRRGAIQPQKTNVAREVTFARKLAVPKILNAKKRLAEETRAKPDVWATPEAAKLFGYQDGDDVKQLLRDRIEFLRAVNKKEDGYKSVVPDEETKTPYTNLELMAVRHRALFLVKAYLIALEKMDLVSFNHSRWKEGFTWNDCCASAVKDLNALGIETFTTAQSLSNQNKKFCESKILLHKNRSGAMRRYCNIFEYYPLTVKAKIVDFVGKNKKQMSVKILQEEVATNILPAALRHAQENGDDINSTEYKLLSKMTAEPPGEHTILKWTSFLRLKYDHYSFRRGKSWSEKQKKVAAQFNYSDPEYRLAQSLRMKEYYRNNPQTGGKRKQSQPTPNHHIEDDFFDDYVVDNNDNATGHDSA